MAKWVFYVLVFVYMCYRAVYGARVADTSISVDQIHYEEDGYLTVGTRKTVNCRAPNKNQRLEWVDPFGNVVKRISSSRVYAQELFVASPKGNRLPGLVLTFSELLASDSGLYQCKSGEQKKTVRVCVIKPSEFVNSDDTPTEVTIEAGRSITLACQATGDPEPRLEWSRNGEELTEDVEHPKYKVNRRYKIQGYESLLTIADVGPDDAGVYHCVSLQESPMLDNCTNYDVRNITLEVKSRPDRDLVTNVKPVFKNDDDTQYVYGTNNEVVDMRCESRGWPKPTYRWFKDLGGGALYEFDKTKILIAEEPYRAVLSVTAGPTTYGNIYKCTASNEFGDTDKLFKLLRREKPWKPDHITHIHFSNHVDLLNVTWDDPVYFPVGTFTVQHIEASRLQTRVPEKFDWKYSATVKWVKTVDAEDVEEESGQEMIIPLTGLEPEIVYFVRVKALNKAGESPWSEPIRVISSIDDSVPDSEDDGDETEESEDEPNAEAEVNNTGMFYGIFFTGGILIVAVVCMFVMRLV